MKRRSLPFRTLALALAAVLFGAGRAALAAGDAAIAGTIAHLSDGAPLAGATVHVADAGTGDIRSSAPSTGEGAFEIRGLSASSYVLAVESEGGLYVVSSPVALAAGERRSVQLAVGSKTAAQTTEPEEEKKRRSIAAFWDNPLTASLAIVGAAFVVGALLGSADEAGVVSPTEE